MNAADAATAMAAKELELHATAARIVALRTRLAEATNERKDLADLLGEGEDGLPLAMLPLTSALVGAVAANGAMFFGYVIILTRFHEAVWNGLLALSMILGVASLPLSSRAGAGGRARLGLRRFTWVGLVMAIACVVVALARRRG
jgi:hypothetical protein